MGDHPRLGKNFFEGMKSSSEFGLVAVTMFAKIVILNQINRIVESA